MTRPCVCGSPGSPGQCHFCKLYATDERYRRLWSGLPQEPYAEPSHVKAGSQAAPEEKARRLAICTVCEYFDPTKTMCRLCRCGLVARAGLLDKHCPLPVPKW